MNQANLNHAGKALLVMDIQKDIVAGLISETRVKLLDSVKAVLEISRSRQIPVIYSILRFREGHPEISSRNRMFARLKEAGRLKEGSEGIQVCDEIAPLASDIVMVRKRVSSFYGTELGIILASLGVDTVILTGGSTEWVVEATARAAADADYRVMVLEDCCASRTPDNHRHTIANILPAFADVISSTQLVAALRPG